MTIVSEVGQSPALNLIPNQSGGAIGLRATAVIDASTEKVALVGTVWHPTVKSGTIDISEIGVFLGAVTINAASVITFSLQDVSATAGPPYQPDGTQDQTADVLGSAITANAWNWSGALSANRTISVGSRLAVVIEYKNTFFNVGDTVAINSLDLAVGTLAYGNFGGIPLLNTGSYALVASALGIVAFKCADGSRAFLTPNVSINGLGTTSVASNGTFRAAGLYFEVETTRKLDTFGLYIAIPNGCDGDIILYDTDGTTALLTMPVDNDSVSATGGRGVVFTGADITLTANSGYRLVFVASTTTAATFYHATVAERALMDGMPGGQNWQLTTRDGTPGNWTETNTSRPWAVLGFSGFDDPSGGGGGLQIAGGNGLA